MTQRSDAQSRSVTEHVPGLGALESTQVSVAEDATAVDAWGFGVYADGEVPAPLGFDRDALEAAGFDGKVGSTLVIPRSGEHHLVAVGLGKRDDATAGSLRDASAAFVRAVARYGALAFDADFGGVERHAALSAITEGALLARYRYTTMSSASKHVPLASLVVIAEPNDADADARAVHAAIVSARAAIVARDLANTPPGHLTASDLADVAVELGARFGFDVEVFGKQELTEMGCGGLLGVNRGSAEEPRMVVLRYRPDSEPTGKLGLVGKGIMYDSGGISLKPSDSMHQLMKMDMGGAAAVLGTFTSLRDAEVGAEVAGWLMCTDNMPSGSSLKLGDVLTARDGTTIEVKNTDAEGRLVLSDGLALAKEDGVDAVIDIATLTGAALVSLGSSLAALFGTDERVVSLVEGAAESTDEQVWRMPLVKKYRAQLDSSIADIANLGGSYGGAITAALFLEHFAGGVPWAHLDIAATMQTEKDDAWRTQGATGFGGRLLLDVAKNFSWASE